MARSGSLPDMVVLAASRIRRPIARVTTEVFAPVPTVAALLVVVSWTSAASAGEAVAWALLSVLFASVLPFLNILGGVHRRRISDHHVGMREQRPAMLLAGAASVLVGGALLTLLGAPRDLVALMVVMAFALLTATLISLFWKISLHAAVSAGALVVLVLLFGPPLLALAGIVVLVAWARVEIGDHTLAQATAGIMLGTVIAGTVFPLLR